MAVAFEAYGTLTAMPAAAVMLGEIELYAWAFTAFVLAQVFAIVLAGRMTDRLGPVIPLAMGAIVFTLGLLLAGLAPTMLILLIARAIQGFGGGALNLALMVLVAQAYSPVKRASMMTALSFCWVFPSFAGPPLSGWITRQFSWHWVFLGLVPILVALFGIGLRPLRSFQRTHAHVREEQSRPVPITAALFGAIGVGLIQFAGQTITASSAFVAAIGLIVLICTLPVLMPPGFLAFKPGLPAVMWTRLLAAGSFYFAESFMPLLMSQVYSFSLTAAGLFLALGACGWTLGSAIQASKRLKIRRDHIIVVGSLIQLVSTGALSACAWTGVSWILTGIAFACSSMAMGLIIASSSLAVMQLSPPAYLGRNMSSFQVGDGIGNSLVTGLAGALFASLHATATSTGTFGPIYFLGVIASLFLICAAVRTGPVRNESAGVG